VPIFAPKAPCPHCGASVKKPKDPAYYLCDSCQKPGPWASPEQAAAWERWQADEARKKAEEEEKKRQIELARQAARQRQLQQAASLTPIEVAGFVAQKGEAVFLEMEAKLAEWTKGRGHYEGGGGIRGVSVRVPGTKGVRAYYGGLSPRQYVPGQEGWAIKDAGTAVITNKRIVFRGQQKGIEWAFAKLLGLGADRSNGSLEIQVSNRQKGARPTTARLGTLRDGPIRCA
jgi:hypothetical protein